MSQAHTTLTFPDGSHAAFDEGATGMDVVAAHFEDKKNQTLAYAVDGTTYDLFRPLPSGTGTFQPVTFDDPEGVEVFRHSSAHLLAQAVTELFPEAQPTIGPVVDEGFYYDFHFRPFTPEDIKKIEKKMKEIVKRRLPIVREEISREEALRLFGDNPFKVEMIEAMEDGIISAYRQGEFVDLCRGPHVPNTRMLKSFKVLKIAGAYWRADATREQLQRVYGISFPDKGSLKEHLDMLAEAEKRDHRKLGKEMDLFSFHPEGPGFVFWHPKGITLLEEIKRYHRAAHKEAGYVEISTPIILNESLWRRSGHWDHYRDNMYFTTIDDTAFAVKPMNCPGGLMVYNSRRHSYRELPLRMAELGLVHRHELSGVLHGLFRVRSFTQDDAHIYCTPDQLRDEVVGVIELIDDMYRAFGLEDYELELSTRPAKRIGSEDMWDKAEGDLKAALEKAGRTYRINPGDGAFYGPKIDFHVRDSMKRTWQCGTIQVDFFLPSPERFNATYEGDDGERHTPVMIHRTVLGSLERFLGVLIEHYAGKLPLWLNPEQLRVLPVTDRVDEYAASVAAKLSEAGLRAEADLRSETLNRKIREAQLARVSYQVVVGDREAEEGTVSVRTRGNKQLGTMTIDELVARCTDEVATRRAPEDE